MKSKKKYCVSLFHKEWKNRRISISCDNSISCNNLTYHYKGPMANVNFNNLIDAATLFHEIKSKIIKLADMEKKLNGV